MNMVNINRKRLHWTLNSETAESICVVLVWFKVSPSELVKKRFQGILEPFKALLVLHLNLQSQAQLAGTDSVVSFPTCYILIISKRTQIHR
jgi:hypothetical protein